MADIFISYAREDELFAQRLASVLLDMGWTVWWDRHLVPGKSFQIVIERELAEASAVLVLWSEVAVRSEWVRSEASDAADRGVLIPVLTERTQMPLRFRIVQATDLSGWDGSSEDERLRGLFAGVRALAGPPAPPGPHLPRPDQATREDLRAEPEPSLPGPDAIWAATVPSDPPPIAPPPIAPPPDDAGEIGRDPTYPGLWRPSAHGARRTRRRRRVVVAVLAAALLVAVGGMALSLTAQDGASSAEDVGPEDSGAVSSSSSPATGSTSTAISVDAQPAQTTTTIDPELVLAIDDVGVDVEQIQTWLRDTTTDPDLEADGEFGEKTERAVRMFESNNGFPVDGQLVINGPEWKLLRKAGENAAAAAAAAEAAAGEANDGVIDPAVETGYGSIDECRGGLWVTIVGAFRERDAAAEEAEHFEGSGVLPSDACPSLTSGHYLVVFGPLFSHDEASALCAELGRLDRDECYVRPIDLDPDFRSYDPDGTFRDDPDS